MQNSAIARMDEATEIMSDEEREAYTLELEEIIQRFPGITPRPLMVLSDPSLPDVYPDSRLLKLQIRLFDDRDQLKAAIVHALVHYASNDPSHGEDFKEFERKLGDYAARRGIHCRFDSKKDATTDIASVNEETPLPTLQQVMTSCIADCLESADRGSELAKRLDRLSDLWKIVESSQRKDHVQEREAETAQKPKEPGQPGKVLKQRCPSCNSSMTYLRISIGHHICRSCGNDWRHGGK